MRLYWKRVDMMNIEFHTKCIDIIRNEIEPISLCWLVRVTANVSIINESGAISSRCLLSTSLDSLTLPPTVLHKSFIPQLFVFGGTKMNTEENSSLL